MTRNQRSERPELCVANSEFVAQIGVISKSHYDCPDGYDFRMRDLAILFVQLFRHSQTDGPRRCPRSST
jgi:hypothetical protein